MLGAIFLVSALKIRDVGSAFLGEEFSGLQELCLDSNLLVDVSGEVLGHSYLNGSVLPVKICPVLKGNALLVP